MPKTSKNGRFALPKTDPVLLSDKLLGYVINVSARSQRTIAQGAVYSARGKVSSFKFRKSSSSNYDYHVKVENFQFKVPLSTFDAFHSGHSYIVYYVPLISMVIVAAEEIA
jgi:hypothetical protein